MSRRGLPAIVATRRSTVMASAETRISLNTKDHLDDVRPPQLPLHFSLVHLAWEGLPHYGSELHVSAELPIQIEFVSAAVRAGARRIVIAGSCFEYGDVEGPIAESFQCCPTTRYGEAKVRLSEECRLLMTRYDVEVIWLRLFFPYGPGQRADSLYGQLAAHHAERHLHPFELRSPNRVHDFVAVSHVAGIIVDAAVFGAAEFALNVGSGRPSTVYEQARRVVAENRWSVDVRATDGDEAHISGGFWADTRKLTSWQRSHFGAIKK